MSYLEQIQRGIDFIEGRLEGPLELREVSRAAGMSHWHFQRMFKALTGETLMAYVRARRLSLSLDRLLRTDARILDIALDAGFESQASFTRAFRQAFGITPGAYRRLGHGARFLRKVRIDADYLANLDRGPRRAPRIVARPKQVLTGQMTELYGVDSHKNNLADKLPQLWDTFLQVPFESIEGARYYGVIEQFSEREERLRYHAAVELPNGAKTDRPLSTVHVPAASYAIFEHHGYAADLDHTVNYIYSVWLMQSGHRHSGGPDLEIYDHRWHASSPHSVVEYAIPLS
ncbi:MAG: helix-turn-helix domain-containing protein [Myxococcota bacterium]